MGIVLVAAYLAALIAVLSADCEMRVCIATRPITIAVSRPNPFVNALLILLAALRSPLPYVPAIDVRNIADVSVKRNFSVKKEDNSRVVAIPIAVTLEVVSAPPIARDAVRIGMRDEKKPLITDMDDDISLISGMR